MGREVYILQATLDTRPEDLLVTPVIEGEGRLRYVASPLVTAMLRGGIAILDEGNRMSEKSWASLAPLLDNRRYVESIVAGIKIKAHPQFRLVATMNDDASTFELPEYIHSRLQPQIFIDFPERDEEYQILKENLPFAEERILNYVTDFLQQAHAADERYTVRDGINIARFAIKLKSLATQRDARDGGARDRRRRRCWERKRCAMPGEIDLPLPDPGSLTARPLHLFPGGARARWSSPSKCGRRSCATGPRWSRWNCRRRCSTPGCAPSRGCRRCRVIFYPDETAGDDQAVYVPVEPADPFTEAIRTGLEIGAEIVFADPDAGAAAAPEGRLSRSVRDPPHRPRAATSRRTACIRSRARRKSRAHAAGIAWKLQGADPLAQRAGGGLAESARPGAGRHGGAAGAAHWRACGARASSCSIRIPESLAEICVEYPALQWRYEHFRAADDRRRPDRPPPRAARRLPRGGEGVRGQHRRAHRALAAAAAGALHPQPGAGRPASSRRASST